jgi:2'-5' RNA ligase
MSDVRCFAAVKLPPEAMAPLLQLQEAMEKEAPDFYRWNSLDTVHLTLFFMGEVDEDQVDEAIRRLEMVKWSPFTLHLEGLLMFPDKNTPKVLAADVRGEDKVLRSLQLKVHDALYPVAPHVEPKAFAPHVTVGRLRKGMPGYAKVLKRAFAKNSLAAGSDFKIESFTLFKSERGPEGPNHIALREFKCGESAGSD